MNSEYTDKGDNPVGENRLRKLLQEPELDPEGFGRTQKRSSSSNRERASSNYSVCVWNTKAQ